MLDAKIETGIPERVRLITSAVICHDTDDLNTEVAIIGDGCPEVSHRTFLFLVWKYIAIGNTGAVVDGDVHIFRSNTTIVALAAPVASDAVPRTDKFPQLFDVDMDDFAGCFAFIAGPDFFGFELRQEADTALFQDATDCG